MVPDMQGCHGLHICTLLAVDTTGNGGFMVTLFGSTVFSDLDKCVESMFITFVDDVKLREEPVLWCSRNWKAGKVD